MTKHATREPAAPDLQAVRYLIEHYLPTPVEGLQDYNYVTIEGPYGPMAMNVGDWRRAQAEIERVRAMPTREPAAPYLLDLLPYKIRIKELAKYGADHIASWVPEGHTEGPDPECDACDDIYGEANALRELVAEIERLRAAPPALQGPAIQAREATTVYTHGPFCSSDCTCGIGNGPTIREVSGCIELAGRTAEPTTGHTVTPSTDAAGLRTASGNSPPSALQGPQGELSYTLNEHGTVYSSEPVPMDTQRDAEVAAKVVSEMLARMEADRLRSEARMNQITDAIAARLGFGCALGTTLDEMLHTIDLLKRDARSALQGPRLRALAQDAIADMKFARSSHLAWATHLEAHEASGEPCPECAAKPYKLDIDHEREWVRKYDVVIALLKSAVPLPALHGLIQEWREQSKLNKTLARSKGTLPEMADRLRIEAEIFDRCADQLSASLQKEDTK